MFTILLNKLAFLILISIVNIKSQFADSNHTVIELNKVNNGTLEADNSYAFFLLIIPEGINPNTQNLVFKIKEPESAEKGIDDFSDPDIYVSTVLIIIKSFIFYHSNKNS